MEVPLYCALDVNSASIVPGFQMVGLCGIPNIKRRMCCVTGCLVLLPIHIHIPSAPLSQGWTVT